MAPGRAQRFRSRSEAERARPRLSANNPVPLVQFADLIGDYRFPEPEWVRCQLVDERGECKQRHGWGWIAQLTDGSEGYIGHDCAEDRFGADPRFADKFAAAAIRVDREITTDLLVARLMRSLADPNVRQAESDALRSRDRLSERLMHTRNLLPRAVLDKLSDRAKRRDMEVMVRVLYIETEVDEKTGRRRQVTKPQDRRWGMLSGLEGLDNRPLLKIGSRLRDAEAALSHAVASVDQPDSSLRKWASAIEYVGRAAPEIRQRAALLDSFCRPENLKLLWLLASDRYDQLTVVNAALEIATRKRVTDEEAGAAHMAWSQEIKDAHGGVDFQLAD
jgi:hypothetical protein